MGLHDKAFRRVMKGRGVAEALMRERLPVDLTRRISGPPTLLSESFIDSSMKGSFADAVLRVPLNGTAAYVYCVVEHKRSEEKFVLVQVLRYLTALYVWLATTESETLPLVVPLIIHNAQTPWRGPRRFRELLRVKPASVLATIDFEVTVLDLTVEPIESLSSHAELKGGLLSLKAAATPTERLEPVIVSLLETLEGDPSAAHFFIRYLLQVLPSDALEVFERVVTDYRQQKEPQMQTIEEYLHSLARRRGDRRAVRLAKPLAKEMAEKMARPIAEQMARPIAEQMAKPIAEQMARLRTRRVANTVRTATLRSNLRQLIDARFKAKPANLDELLADADASTLQKWFDAALTAKSARAVFASH